MTISLSTHMNAMRSFSFPLSTIPILTAVAIVLPPNQWKIDILILSIISAMLLHAIGNMLNDFFDFKAGVDRKVEGDERRPGRVLVKKVLNPSQMMREIVLTLLVVVPMITYIIFRTSFSTLWFCAVALFALYIYTGPPLRLKYHALGEMVIFFAFGPVLMLGAAIVQTGHWSWEVIYMSIPVGLLTTAVLVGNNIRDYDEDRQAAITTIPHIIGIKKAKMFFTITVLLPFAIILALAALNKIPVLTLMSIVGIIPAVKLCKDHFAQERIPDIDSRTSKVAALFYILLTCGFVVSNLIK